MRYWPDGQLMLEQVLQRKPFEVPEQLPDRYLPEGQTVFEQALHLKPFVVPEQDPER